MQLAPYKLRRYVVFDADNRIVWVAERPYKSHWGVRDTRDMAEHCAKHHNGTWQHEIHNVDGSSRVIGGRRKVQP